MNCEENNYSPLLNTDSLEKEDVISNKNNEKKPKINVPPVGTVLPWHSSVFLNRLRRPQDFSVVSFSVSTSFPFKIKTTKKHISELSSQWKANCNSCKPLLFWFRLFQEQLAPTTSEEGQKGHNRRDIFKGFGGWGSLKNQGSPRICRGESLNFLCALGRQNFWSAQQNLEKGRDSF